MHIEEYIPFGHENAISRKTLSMLLKMPDRQVRREIQRARDRGAIIINTQDGRGYYVTDNVDEIAKQYRQNRRRALSVLRQQKYLRQILKAAGREV